jgi:hypothetical protein
MLLLPNHPLEVFWLKRRIQFLEEIDNLATIDAEPDEFVYLAKHFRSVESPLDLIECIKTIYGDKLS